jgi:hypothetical protein
LHTLLLCQDISNESFVGRSQLAHAEVVPEEGHPLPTANAIRGRRPSQLSQIFDQPAMAEPPPILYPLQVD